MFMTFMTSFAQTAVDVEISPASGDITAALNNALNGKAARSITINLAAGASYTLSNPIMPGNNLIINGADGAVIDASNLTGIPGKKGEEEKGTNSFILMSDQPAISMTSNYYRVNEVTIKNVTIKGLKNALFSDHEVKYCIVNFTIDNVVLQALAGSKQDALIAFKKGGYKDFTIKNSTVYGNNSKNAKCFTVTKSDLKAMGYDITKNRHYVTYLNNTFVNVLPVTSAETWAQEAFNSMAYVTYDIQNNIWYGCGLDIVIGLVGKDMVPEAKVTFSQNSYFNPDENTPDVMKDQAPLESVTDVSNNILTTNPTFTDIEKGDFHLHPGSLQAKFKTGDPRWLVAYNASQALPADIVMNLHKAENISDVLDTVIKRIDKLGDIYLTLAPNAKYILTNTIKSPGSVTIIGEGTMINCTRLSGPMILLEGTDSLANTVGDQGKIMGKSKYKHVETVNVTGIKAALKNATYFFRETQKTLVDNFIVSDCVFEVDGTDCLIDFAGYPANLEISNTTIWSEKGHTGHLLHASGRVKDLDKTQATLTQTVTMDHCTLYQISQGTGGGLNELAGKGSRALAMTLTNSIIYNCGDEGTEVEGWLGGLASDGPASTYDHNTYWSNGSQQTGWIDESVDGADATGTAYNADPGFFDVVGGDFAIATMSPQAKDSETGIQNGDPRWSTWAAGDYFIRTSYSGQGEVLVNRTYANEGTKININCNPADGYVQASIAVVDANGNSIPLDDEVLAPRRAGDEGDDEPVEDIEDDLVIKSFTMPSSPVTIHVVFQEATTAIGTVTNTGRQDGKWYTLSGVPVERPAKGMYIHNGKKVVIK